MFKQTKLPITLFAAAAILGLVSCGGSGKSSSSGSSSASSSASSSGSSSSTASSSTVADNKLTVTFKNGDTVLKTDKVEKGGTATSYTPTVAGKDFVDWYLTPSFSRLYDFSTIVNENLTLYGAFSVYAKDPSVYYLAGSGKSPLLSTSNWGKVASDELKLAQKDVSQDAIKKNIYTLTCDFYADDAFQITALSGDPLAWGRQFGFGYLANYKECSTFIESQEGLADTKRKSNIKVTQDGNYTITLTTYPDHDNDSEELATAKINNVDRIVIKRNGDILVPKAEFDTNYYIKGEKVTAWKDMRNSLTKMTLSTDKATTSLTRFLVADDQVMFVSTLTNLSTGETTDGNEYIKYANLDTASKELFVDQGGNMKVKAAGQYVFTYTIATKVLSVTFDGAKTLTVGQYYVNGKIGTHNWDTVFVADFRLAAVEGKDYTYAIASLVLAENDEFVIAGFKADATAPGESWVNSIGSWNYANMGPSETANPNASFKAKDQYNNILVKTAGTYTITLNVYSGILTATVAA